MTALAERINAYLSPARRQAIYQIFAVLGMIVTAVSPALSNPVAQWSAIVQAVATVLLLVLAAVVTKAPQWPAIYSGLAVLIAALVGASLITQGVADVALRVLQAAITAAPLFVILARTDTSTADGSPTLEAAARDAAVAAAAASVTPAPAPLDNATVTVKNGDATYDPGNGGPTTVTPGVV